MDIRLMQDRLGIPLKFDLESVFRGRIVFLDETWYSYEMGMTENLSQTQIKLCGLHCRQAGLPAGTGLHTSTGHMPKRAVLADSRSITFKKNDSFK